MRFLCVVAVAGAALLLGASARDRLARFQHLTGEAAPSADIVSALGGTVPVVHVVFPERAFFDFDADQPRPDSSPLLQIVAAEIRREPGMVTVLGHTDAVGSANYNIDLGRRRAEAVLRALVWRGVDAGRLSTVAIGKAQPIASNATAAGRALNRRVEFLFSDSLQANLDVVRMRRVNPAFVDAAARGESARVRVFGGEALLAGSAADLPDLVLRAPAAAVRRRVPAAGGAPPHLNTPEPIEKRELEPPGGD